MLRVWTVHRCALSTNTASTAVAAKFAAGSIAASTPPADTARSQQEATVSSAALRYATRVAAAAPTNAASTLTVASAAIAAAARAIAATISVAIAPASDALAAANEPRAITPITSFALFSRSLATASAAAVAFVLRHGQRRHRPVRRRLLLVRLLSQHVRHVRRFQLLVVGALLRLRRRRDELRRLPAAAPDLRRPGRPERRDRLLRLRLRRLPVRVLVRVLRRQRL